MSDVIDRLRLLQRQSGRCAEAASRVDTGADNVAAHGNVVSNIRADLRRLLARRERHALRTLIAPAGVQLAPGLYQVERRWPSDLCGSVRLPSPGASDVQRERLVCFDTETTGLAGGVGTKAFMIGAAYWRGAELIVMQWYLTALAGEAPMLHAFADCLPPDAIFVSYNGRSYDTPLLKGRYRMHRQPSPFDERLHVDLLHPVRRAYRGVWENCRLQTIERRLLGIVRENDLPGSEAPAAWLAFLRGQSSTQLARVIEHNRQDLLTLTLLLDRMAAPSEPVPEQSACYVEEEPRR